MLTKADIEMYKTSYSIPGPFVLRVNDDLGKYENLHLFRHKIIYISKNRMIFYRMMCNLFFR